MTPATALSALADPPTVARVLAAFDGSVASIALAGELARVALLLVAVALAVAAWPSWRRRVRPLGLVALGPMLLLGVAGAALASGGEAAGAPEGARRMLLSIVLRQARELAFLLPGAVVALAWLAAWRAEAHAGAAGAGEARELPALVEPVGRPSRGRRGPGTWAALRAAAGWGTAMVAWSFLCYFTLHFAPHPRLEVFEEAVRAQPPATATLFTVALVLAAVLGEELAWRGVGMAVVLAALGRRVGRREAAALAILATSLGWTAIHSGSLVFGWTKYAQIFPLGLALGVAMARHGFGAALGAHMIHNLAPYVFVALGGRLPGSP